MIDAVSNKNPSFVYKTSELLRRRERTRDEPQWRFKEKLGAYVLLDRLRIPHAKVRGTLDGLDRLTPDHLTEPVVLKPLRGNGSSGVVLLEPDGAVWADRLRRRKLTFDELIAYERHILKARGFDDLWLLESPFVAADPDLLVPDDFKIYAFQGEVGLIVQRRGWTGVRYQCYTPDWQPVDTGKHTGKIGDDLPAPDAAEGAALLDVARRISRAYPFPFCRIDAFVTDHGIAVGELNCWAGGYDRFNPEWDRTLGAMWENAEPRTPHRWRPVLASVITGDYPSRSRWLARRR